MDYIHGVLKVNPTLVHCTLLLVHCTRHRVQPHPDALHFKALQVHCTIAQQFSVWVHKPSANDSRIHELGHVSHLYSCIRVAVHGRFDRTFRPHYSRTVVKPLVILRIAGRVLRDEGLEQQFGLR